MDKQIEEMARIIAFDLCPNRHVHAKWGEEAQCYSDNNFAECTKIKNVVDKLFNAGFRKIHEDAVVLTREEYSDYLVMKDAHQNAIERCEKLQADNERLYKNIGKFKDAVRKETAKKFAERVKEETDHGISALYDSTVDKIAKEITEGDNG